MIDLACITDQELEAWARCTERATLANPFFEPDCQIPATTYLLAGEDPSLIMVEEDGEVVACLPIRTTQVRFGPIRRRVASSRVPGVGYAVNFGDPIISDQCVELATDRIVESLQEWSREGGPGIAILDWLDDEDGGFRGALQRSCEARKLPIYVQRRWERPIIRRIDGAMSLSDSLDGKARRNINRHRRRLEELLDCRVALVDRNDHIAVEEFLRLEASGWKGTQGTAYLCRPELESFFRSLCANYADTGRLHLLSLQANDRVLAMLCCLTSGTEAFLFRVGSDAEFDSYGVGVLAHVMSCDYLESIGANLVDSCGDEGNSFLERLYPHRRRMASVVMATGGETDRVLVRAKSFMTSLRSTSRDVPR